MTGARIGVVVLAVVACKKEPRVVAPPNGPPVVLEPAHAPALPAVAPGHLRLDALDVDIAVPDGARAHHFMNVTEVMWGTCRAEIEPSWDGKPPRKVGTLVVECRAKPECAAVCDTLAAVPGGTANDPYPSEPPAIELATGGGMSQALSEAAYVWTDGTVQFAGDHCDRWRGRRGKLPPERVAAVLAGLERGGVFRYQRPGRDEINPCPDAGSTWLRVRAHGNDVELATRLICDKPDPPVVADAIAAVASMLGANPCASPP